MPASGHSRRCGVTLCVHSCPVYAVSDRLRVASQHVGKGHKRIFALPQHVRRRRFRECTYGSLGRPYNDFCFSPHSLHLNSVRSAPTAMFTRFGAPHFPHLTSLRESSCLIVSLRAVASFIAASDCARSSSFVSVTCFLNAMHTPMNHQHSLLKRDLAASVLTPRSGQRSACGLGGPQKGPLRLSLHAGRTYGPGAPAAIGPVGAALRTRQLRSNHFYPRLRSRLPDPDGRQSERSLIAPVRESASGPGCVKSRTDATILFVNRLTGATDVRLCGRD
jgi:hypothetical protein